MYNLVLILHIIVSLALIGIILIQRGRSGGLIEALGGVESIFGTKTSSFFVKLTVTLVVLFFLTSISLAYLSKQKSKSLLERASKSHKIPAKNESQKTEASLPPSGK
ncbi:MAG: preprotein translocase subunit SecG [Candidatus Omnitrophica bacterium]|nr:preprotein translocase subunit SecG [Candidatus Omnitrophota bacterium]